MNMRSATSLAITVVLLVMRGKASAQPCGGYEVTAIVSMDECPPFGNPPVTPMGINEQGWMVGFFNACVIGPNTAFLWTPDDGLVVIPMPAGTTQSRALAISGSKIVGTHVISGDEFGDLGFLYDFETDEFTSLGTLPGGTTSEVGGMNGKGEIVGSWGDTVKGPFPLAFIWREGEMIDINPDFGTDASRGLDINDNGLVTGWMGTGNLIDSHAFIWDDGNVTELPFIPGGFTSVGEVIGDNETVSGWGLREEGDPPETVTRAFHWQNGEMLDLGTLPDHLRSGALGMRTSPLEIVGRSWNFQGNQNVSHAVVWNNEGLHDLNDLVRGNDKLNFKSAVDINQAGQITARAANQFNDVVGVLLTPIQETQGDLDNDCRVGASDLLLLLSSWGACDSCAWCTADLNQDCTVGAADLLLLLMNWG